MSIIQIKNLSRDYPKTGPVLQHLNLQMEAGEVVGLIGRNGAGKSTLIQLMMGLLRPHSGTIRIFGMDPIAEPVQVKQRIGYVAEDHILPGSLTAIEIFAIYKELYPSWSPQLATELAERFDIPHRRPAGSFSKGQARSLALLLALSVRPELLILDEPAAGLDPAARRDFLSTSIEHAAAEGITILFSSHQMTDVERLASRVLLLQGGKIALDRPLDTLAEDFSVLALPQEQWSANLNKLNGVLGSSHAGKNISLLFERQASELQLEVDQMLGAGVGECHAIPLEDLFIHLVGSSDS